MDVTSDNLEPLVRERLSYYGKIEVGTYVLDNVLASDVYGPSTLACRKSDLASLHPWKLPLCAGAVDEWFAAQHNPLCEARGPAPLASLGGLLMKHRRLHAEERRAYWSAGPPPPCVVIGRGLPFPRVFPGAQPH